MSKPSHSPENDLNSGPLANLLQENKIFVDGGYNPFGRVLEDLADLDSEPEENTSDLSDKNDKSGSMTSPDDSSDFKGPESPTPPQSETETESDTDYEPLELPIPPQDPHPLYTESQDRQHQIDLLLGNPTTWDSVPQAIETFKTGSWLDAALMDYFLLELWIKAHVQAPVFLIPVRNATELRDVEFSEEWAPDIRRLLFLPTQGPIDQKPVLVPVFHGHHYFLAVFNYQTQCAYVLGQRITLQGPTTDIPWKTWKGPLFWSRIAQSFGWQTQLEDISLSGVNWIQNGYDCGPTLCFLITKLIQGLPLDDYNNIYMPEIECAHRTRLQMLHAVHSGLLRSVQAWTRLSSAEGADIFDREPEESSFLQITGPELRAQFEELAIGLTQAEDSCLRCKQAYLAKSSESQNSDNVEVDLGSSPEESSDRDSNVQPNVPAAKRKKFTLLERARDRSRMKPVAPSTVKAHITIPAQKFNPLPRDANFDDYFGGPTLEDMRWLERSSRIEEAYPIGRYAIPTIRSPWELFKDYGYRLEPSFSTMFNDSTPQFVAAHLLPIGDPPQSTTAEMQPDACVVGMSQTLLMAGPAGSRSSMEAFVQGKLGSQFICVDLEQDHCPLHPDEVVLSMDIDSIIWVTRLLRVRTEVMIHQLPDSSRMPHLAAHNHVYVELLIPQSEEDKVGGGRTEWWTHRYALSTIPHAHFGKVGQGPGSFDIHVFWPRMKHKNYLTGRWTTLVPVEIQSRWLSQVVHPAIIQHSDSGILPYVDFTLEHLEMKMSKKHVATKCTPVDASRLERVQRTMRQIIKENGPLAMFGSFFFMADIRGIKRSTSVLVNSGRSPYDVLLKKFPSMDWEYMLDRQNGELFMDLGMAFHPNPKDKEPLIGLWRLDKLRNSFAAAGMKAGTEHHANTLANYGGIQSEMAQKRAAIVQLTFRSAYNLVFEIIRRPEKNYFCEDVDAHDVNQAFVDCIGRYEKMYKTSSEKLYGTREEIRGSGRAIKQALSVAPQKMREYLQSDPIIWVKSSVVVDFLSRRMVELKNTQIQFSRIRKSLSNYQTLTSIIMHLIRYVAVTPQTKLAYLREALRDMHFLPVMQNFGMFFIHNLDFDRGTVDDIAEEDGPEANRIMATAKTNSRPARTVVNSIPTAIYPLGNAPSWQEVKTTMACDPGLLINVWNWDENWNCHRRASALFVQFTVEMWLSLNRESLETEVPHPETLQDAMKTWTYASLSQAFKSSSFIPSSHNLDGPIPGRRTSSFGEMSRIFFPPADYQFNHNSAWRPFLDSGYILKYHDALSTMDQDSQEHLNRALSLIFDGLQCLPHSLACGSGAGRIWRVSKGCVLFLTNPVYYRLEKIGPAVIKRRGPVVRIKVNPATIAARLDAEHNAIPVKVTKSRLRKSKKIQRRLLVAHARARKRQTRTGQGDGSESAPRGPLNRKMAALSGRNSVGALQYRGSSQSPPHRITRSHVSSATAGRGNQEIQGGTRRSRRLLAKTNTVYQATQASRREEETTKEGEEEESVEEKPTEGETSTEEEDNEVASAPCHPHTRKMVTFKDQNSSLKPPPQSLYRIPRSRISSTAVGRENSGEEEIVEETPTEGEESTEKSDEEVASAPHHPHTRKMVTFKDQNSSLKSPPQSLYRIPRSRISSTAVGRKNSGEEEIVEETPTEGEESTEKSDEEVASTPRHHHTRKVVVFKDQNLLQSPPQSFRRGRTSSTAKSDIHHSRRPPYQSNTRYRVTNSDEEKQSEEESVPGKHQYQYKKKQAYRMESEESEEYSGGRSKHQHQRKRKQAYQKEESEEESEKEYHGGQAEHQQESEGDSEEESRGGQAEHLRQQKPKQAYEKEESEESGESGESEESEEEEYCGGRAKHHKGKEE